MSWSVPAMRPERPALGGPALALCLLTSLANASAGALAAAPAGEEWLEAGHDGSGGYYSPLRLIDRSNVARLGFAWQFETGTDRGLEATPLVHGDRMYATGNWGVVYALDARTGAPLWTFDPPMDHGRGRDACCDVVNRGVALSAGRLYVAALDGRLYALDENSGRPIWSVDTIVDHHQPYTVTSAPQIAGDLVIIGNSGSDIGHIGVRGYVTAYDRRTGSQRWRFFTVPSRSDPDPLPEARRALASWDPRAEPRGGTVWGPMSYDPALKLVYIGTGNAAPYEQRSRNPGGGDSDDLYASSIIALHRDTGRMAWHYQTTPGDRWDQDACAPFVQAELRIDGHERHVLLQASKNGFFYVLDRATGELISGKPFTYVNWTSGLDARGRPIPIENGDYRREPKLIYPSAGGAHSWAPMALNPATGFVYIPVLDSPMIWMDLEHRPLHYQDGSFGVGVVFPDKDYRPEDWEMWFGKLPRYPPAPDGPRVVIRGVLRAWDPVRQTTVWEQETSRDYFVYDGGTMTSAGDLVFQGRADGDLVVYGASDGAILRTLHTGVAIMGAPMTYAIGDTQYVAVMEGYGGGAIPVTLTPNVAAFHRQNSGRILVLRLDGGDPPLPALRTAEPLEEPPAMPPVQPAQIVHGGSLYASYCSRCHVFGPGLLPDLRRLPRVLHERFEDIVLRGLLSSRGMGRFDDQLSREDVGDLHAYLIDEGRKLFEDSQRAAAASGASRDTVALPSNDR